MNLNNQIYTPKGNNLIKSSEVTFNNSLTPPDGEISLTRKIEIKLNPSIAKAENYGV